MFGHFAFMPALPQAVPAWGDPYAGPAQAPALSPEDRARLQHVIEQDATVWNDQKFTYAGKYKDTGLVRDLAAFMWASTMETLTRLLGPMADGPHRHSPIEMAQLSRACIAGFQRMQTRAHGHSHAVFLFRRHDLLQMMLNRAVDNELMGLRHSPRYPDFLRCMTELCACDNPERGLALLREAYHRLGLPWPACTPSLMNHTG